MSQVIDVRDLQPGDAFTFEGLEYVASDQEAEPGFIVAIRKKDDVDCTFEYGDMVKVEKPPRLRAPGLDDGESPFHPIPGVSSAGEY